MDTHSAMKVVLYSHDSLGIGHVRRNVAIAHQIAAASTQRGVRATGLIISGLAEATAFPLPHGFDWLFIPAIHKRPQGYVPRNLGEDWSTLMSVRSRIIQAALTSFVPDLVIVDRHIFGVDGELAKPLRKLRKKNPAARVVLGLREVLDDPCTARAEWDSLDAAAVDETVDAVWLYGDPAVHDAVATGEIPSYLAERTTHTGYLAFGREATEDTTAAESIESPFILTTAGGGADGYALLSTAARMEVPTGHTHVIITGPQMHESQYQALRTHAAVGTEVYRMWPGLSQLIARASAVITMGGYNTIAEVLATETPALVVPREVPRTEQLIRATALAKAGAVELLRLNELSVDSLSTWAAHAVTRTVSREHIDRHGLRTVGELAAPMGVA